MSAYYNEIDPFAAAWLRNLVTAGLICAGDVDERSIVDVLPNDLKGYKQCHFFAGIGVWSYALRQAGWSDDCPIWTGSCPCQPFSAAGKGEGFTDERHLWPAFFHLIEQCGPAIVIGEQVASKDANAWIDLVQADLEALEYAFGVVPFPSAGVGAPHIRDRAYWMAYTVNNGRGKLRLRLGEQEGAGEGVAGQWEWLRAHNADGSAAGGLGLSNGTGSQSRRDGCATTRYRHSIDPAGSAGGMAYAGSEGSPELSGRRLESKRPSEAGGLDWPGPTNGLWRNVDWLGCRDGKWRPVEPGTFPLAHGSANRVGRLRGYGNAINAAQATSFVEAAMEFLQ